MAKFPKVEELSKSELAQLTFPASSWGGSASELPGLAQLFDFFSFYKGGASAKVTVVSLDAGGQASVAIGGVRLGDGKIRGELVRVRNLDNELTSAEDLAAMFTPMEDVQLVIYPKTKKIVLGSSALYDVVSPKPISPFSEMLWGRLAPKGGSPLAVALSSVRCIMTFENQAGRYRT